MTVRGDEAGEEVRPRGSSKGTDLRTYGEGGNGRQRWGEEGLYRRESMSRGTKIRCGETVSHKGKRECEMTRAVFMGVGGRET